MSKILKYTSWQSPTGKWYCNDTSDLAGIAGLWWVPARLMELTPAAYVKWLVETYKPDHITFTDNNVLIYSWDKEHYSLMHSFVLYINRVAKNKNFLV